MTAYYNEFDPYCAAWLRNLMAAGHIPPGDVDERDIREVAADDLEGYTQHHFFAGLGGWSLALELAGWPDDRPVWTGSCPCQPFSAAGKQGGTDDERHLWPEWFRLARECRPDTIFGEQVEGSVGFGWIDRVFADLEAEDYACGAAVLGAHSVGAPHIRQRLWWVADAADCGRQHEPRQRPASLCEEVARAAKRREQSGDNGTDGGLADTSSTKRRSDHDEPDAETDGRGYVGRNSETGGLADTDAAGSQGYGQSGQRPGERAAWPTGGADFWAAHDLIPCADGKSRRVESGIQPLAHGVSARVGKLRAAGNAIVPQVAAEFVMAWMETG